MRIIYSKGQRVLILKPNKHYTYTGIATLASDGFQSGEIPNAWGYRFSTDKTMYNTSGDMGKEGTGMTYDICIQPLLDVTMQFSKAKP